MAAAVCDDPFMMPLIRNSGSSVFRTSSLGPKPLLREPPLWWSTAMGELSYLEDRLGYHFEEPELLRRALIHPSAERTGSVTPEDIAHARRLSWLGDSVLDMVVSDKLYTLFPTATKE